MEKHQERAWDILTETERNSLFLQMSQGQSSWEAGEILGISHYKYLELRERSVKFFKMFSEFFYKWGNLFNPKSPVDERFRDYIEACIEKRMSRKDAVSYSGDSSQLVTEIHRRTIIKNMNRLKESKNEWDIDLYHMIMEFDRWNNSRILPRSIQQMSAYKRRNNKREKIYIQYLHKIPDWKIKAIIDCYQYNPKKNKGNFICVFSTTLFEDGYQIVRIKDDKVVIKKISELSMYIFENEKIADAFGYMVSTFFEKTKGPKLGIKFWQEYRDLLKLAINFNQVNNLDFYSDKLDMAYEIPNKYRKQKTDIKASQGVKSTPPELFYIE